MRFVLPITTWVYWLLLCLAIIILPNTQLNAAWNTTQFEVVQGEPGSLVDSFVEGLGFVDLDENTVAEVENYLAEVAREYERLGFREPALDDKSLGNHKFQIFIYDYEDSVSGAGYSIAVQGSI